MACSKPELAVLPIEGKGRGVVAIERIAAGTMIETAPVVPYKTVGPHDVMPEPLLPPELANLPHDWDEECACLVFGAMQFANHSDAPNARFTRNIETLTMTFTALRDIEAGEEITIDYETPIWWE
jgi:SET domain-containing protein